MDAMTEAQPLPPVSPTDEALIAKIRAGRVEFFELLMRRHNRRVYRVVRAVLRDDAEVEDVMQEAYLSAFSHLGDFSGQARFSTWLTRIAVHEAFARLRKRRPVESFDETDRGIMASPSRDPEQNASDAQLRRLLEQAVAELPESFRLVFMLRAIEGLSVEETADCLEIVQETVKTRLHRARSLLREDLTARVGSALPSLFDFHLTRCDRVVSRVLESIDRKGPTP